MFLIMTVFVLKTKPYLRADKFLIKEKLFKLNIVVHAFNHITVDNGGQRLADLSVFEARIVCIANFRLARAT